MKKIAFSDKYGMNQAVLERRKTMTRRIIPDIIIDWNRRGRVKLPIKGFSDGTLFVDASSILPELYQYTAPSKYQPRFQVGEKVAVAQRYKDFIHQYDWVGKELYQDHPGWINKMFVCADLMPHRIRITNIKLERLQDISDEDCIKEGIMEGEFMNTWDTFYFDQWGDVPNHITFKTPHAAFASLIDRISGKGTWERNPWVFVYEFELVNEKQ